jgi:hypothetical protein
MNKARVLAKILTFTLVSMILFSQNGFTQNVEADSSASSIEYSWFFREPMQYARGSLGVAAVEGKIYAIGGSSAGSSPTGQPYEMINSPVGITEEYDPLTDTWVMKASMPTARTLFAIAPYEDKIYCMGGFGGSTTSLKITGVNEVFDPSSNTWQTRASMPHADEGMRANTVNGKIYVIGGWFSNATRVYDPVTDIWTDKTPMPVRASCYGSVALDNKIYIFSGSGHDTNVDALTQIYDTVSDTWSFGTPLPTQVDYAGAAMIAGNAPENRRVCVIGFKGDLARSAETKSTDEFKIINYVFDLQNNSWTEDLSVPTIRLSCGTAVINETIYAIGGFTFDQPTSNPWYPPPLCYPSAVNEQYTPFGYGNIKPVVVVFTPQNDTWANSYRYESVNLGFFVNKPVQWMGYNLDGKANVTISGNETIPITKGWHNVVVYVNDTNGNTGYSRPTHFYIGSGYPLRTNPPASFPNSESTSSPAASPQPTESGFHSPSSTTDSASTPKPQTRFLGSWSLADFAYAIIAVTAILVVIAASIMKWKRRRPR